MLDRRKDSASRLRSEDRVAAGIIARILPLQRPTVFLLIALLLAISGCRPLRNQEKTGVLDRMASIGGIRGPLERSLQGEESALELGRRYTEAERREARRCREAFDKGDYDLAIKLGKKTAKKFKESSLGEEAQFYLAESYFAQGQYAKAQDGYTQLFEDYPSTRYVEPATRRLFRVARVWLEVAEPVAKNEIRQVSGEKVLDEGPPPKPPLDPTLRVRILPNFHDKNRPMFDTQGRALECLKSIWMNDPTGPLADDALMLTATYYQRHDNYVEADRYFEILREEYPDSPHLEEAFLLGSHVKQMSYQGPYYEGRELTGARKLKEQSLQLFPASHQRQQLRKDLDQLYLLEAQRAWSKVEYYQKKRRPRAVAIACIQLLSEYPDTTYAKDARALLRTIDKKELTGLPEVPEFVESLPPAEPPGSGPPAEREGAPVKSVSDPRVIDQ
jgi:outer membrane protein assembly factor BamD (BamD/ComL family)